MDDRPLESFRDEDKENTEKMLDLLRSLEESMKVSALPARVLTLAIVAAVASLLVRISMTTVKKGQDGQNAKTKINYGQSLFAVALAQTPACYRIVAGLACFVWVPRWFRRRRPPISSTPPKINSGFGRGTQCMG
jgi:hypothetical protein